MLKKLALAWSLLVGTQLLGAGNPPILWRGDDAQLIPTNLCFKDHTCQSTAGGGGGGTPGGSPTQLQYNLGGSFAGVANSSVDTGGQLGLNVSTPLAELHAVAQDMTIPAPLTISVTETLEVAGIPPGDTQVQISGAEDPTGVNATFNGAGGTYTANGSNWDVQVTSANLIGGVYYGGTTQDFNLGGDGGSGTFDLNTTWSPGGTDGDGYIWCALANSAIQDCEFISGIGTSNYSGNQGAPPASLGPSFAAIAFPYNAPATAPSPLSGVNISVVNEGGGQFGPSDGSSYTMECDSAEEINSVWYVAGSPSSAVLSDNNDGQTFDWQTNWTPGGGAETNVICRLRNTSEWGDYIYNFMNTTSPPLSYPSSGDDSVARAAWGVTYPGVVPTSRHINVYGLGTSPGGFPYYSATDNNYIYTDSNPPAGYIWSHVIAGGNLNNAKVLGANDGQSLSASFTTANPSTFYEMNTGVFSGNTTVTPSHYGFQATGGQMVRAFRAFSKNTSPAFYSPTHTDTNFSITDSLYYYYTLTWTNDSAYLTKILEQVNGGGFAAGYQGVPSASLIVDALNHATNFASGTTVTPASAPGNAGLFQSDSTSTVDAAQVTLQSTVSSAVRLDLRDQGNGMLAQLGFDPITTTSYFNSSNGDYDFRNSGAGELQFHHDKGVLNSTGTQNYQFNVKGGTGANWLYGDGSASTWYMGFNNSAPTVGSGATLTLEHPAAGHPHLYLDDVNNATPAILEQHSNTQDFMLNQQGQVIVHSTTTSPFAHLSIGGATTSYQQIRFESPIGVPGSVGLGLMSMDSQANLTISDSSTLYRIAEHTTSSPTASAFPFVASSGRLESSGSPIKIASSEVQVSTYPFTVFNNLKIASQGFGLLVKEGSGATMGICTLSSGACTVTNSKTTANSRIFVTSQVDGGTPGFLRVDTRTAGTSFHIKSSSASDTSTAAWIIIEPAP